MGLEIFVFSNLIAVWKTSFRIHLFTSVVAMVMTCSFAMKYYYESAELERSTYAFWLFRLVIVVSCFMGYCVQVPFVFYYCRNNEQRKFFLCKFIQLMACFVFGMGIYYFCQAYVLVYTICSQHLRKVLHFSAISVYDFTAAHMFTNVFLPLFMQLGLLLSKPFLRLALPVHRERLHLCITSWVESFITAFGRIVFANVDSTWLMVALILKDNVSHVLDYGVRYQPFYMARLLVKDKDEHGFMQTCIYKFLKGCDLNCHVCDSLCTWPGDQSVDDESLLPASTLHQAYLDSATYRRMRTSVQEVSDFVRYCDSSTKTRLMHVTSRLATLSHRAKAKLRELQPLDFSRAMHREQFLFSTSSNAGPESSATPNGTYSQDDADFGVLSMSVGLVTENVRFFSKRPTDSTNASPAAHGALHKSSFGTGGYHRIPDSATLELVDDPDEPDPESLERLNTNQLQGPRWDVIIAEPLGEPLTSSPLQSAREDTPLIEDTDPPPLIEDTECPRGHTTVNFAHFVETTSSLVETTPLEKAASVIQAYWRGEQSFSTAPIKRRDKKHTSTVGTAQILRGVQDILPDESEEAQARLLNRMAYVQRYLRLRFSGVVLVRLLSSIVGVVVLVCKMHLPCTLQAYGWSQEISFRDALSWTMFLVGDLCEAFFILRNFRHSLIDQPNDAGLVFTRAVLWNSKMFPLCVGAVVAHVTTDAYLSSYRLQF